MGAHQREPFLRVAGRNASRNTVDLIRPACDHSGMELTAVFKKVPEGYIGWVEELPGANTQGSTLAETQENLIEAIQMILEANHELTGTPIPAEFILREKVSLASA
ncbi:MAG: type II toxin-antitoxin system HicB family antitoxin [Terriglobia bacterium]